MRNLLGVMDVFTIFIRIDDFTVYTYFKTSNFTTKVCAENIVLNIIIQ